MLTVYNLYFMIQLQLIIPQCTTGEQSFFGMNRIGMDRIGVLSGGGRIYGDGRIAEQGKGGK